MFRLFINRYRPVSSVSFPQFHPYPAPFVQEVRFHHTCFMPALAAWWGGGRTGATEARSQAKPGGARVGAVW